jgi:membrane-associated phospholipid phosphatase
MKGWTLGFICTVVLLLPPTVVAQTPAQQTAPQTSTGQQGPPAAVGEEGNKPTRGFFSALGHNLVDDVKHMPRWNSVYWLAGGGALALAIHSEDHEINHRLVNSSTDNLWVPGHVIGSTEVIIPTALATYFIGRHVGARRAQHLGMDELEAALLSEGFVQTIKVAVRRERPRDVGGALSNSYSFPSGHATITFAAATVLQQHLGYKAAIPTYTVASYVAMSRLHDNRHFASDVIFGAAMGVMIGRSVTWHGRNFYASPMLLPGGAGIQLALGPVTRR